jgi:hypothetical protein
MIDEIVEAWHQGQSDSPVNSSGFECRYCHKEFRRESTLAAHICETKRRWQQEKEVGVQLGFRAYLRFYEVTQGSAKLKSYEDFVASSYYTAFVKFGRHLVAIRAVNSGAFIDWVIRENKKLDHWCKESIYVEYLHQYMRREAVQDAVERALLEMQSYADEVKTLANFNDYFRYGNANRICHHISNGRISPWIVFNCTSGVAFLEQLNEEQIAMILPWIDPDFWQRKFKDYVADTEWTKMVLGQAGL